MVLKYAIRKGMGRLYITARDFPEGRSESTQVQNRIPRCKINRYVCVED